jgi:3,4-dihydroxy-2-butanone 4-phosphate synthase
MMRGDELVRFSRAHGYPMLTIAELVSYRREQEAETVSA